ncbi:adenylate cyclase type 10-like isoform X2 [Saccostrea cucullata]|uniref:adenylate cyclase type 10-like isoform X2 n=1 Tax=Saccostrea cuccullata TaxID=36930 RepID=UPI002ED5532A
MEDSQNISDRKGTPKILQLIRQAQGLAPNPEEESALKKLTPHVPGIVTFANHSRALPWTTSYTTVLMFADISGFTALCEKYGAKQNAGIDQLTKTLNAYLGEIVENIISSEGDVLKFAGDAILSVWRVNDETELGSTVDQVTKCCLNIQNKCGAWETDIGVTLTVKMGVSAGEMSVTFLGNNEFRVYVELGPAVCDVNVAEHFCEAGHIVLSPRAWELSSHSLYNHELLPDGQHARIKSFRMPRTAVSETQRDGPLWFMRKRKMSGDWGKTVTGITAASAFSEGVSKSLFTTPIPINNEASTSKSCDDESDKGDIKHTPTTSSSRRNSEPAHPTIAEEGSENHTRPGKPKLGLSKLRNVVKTVREMRLDESLRLYILHPVLKKLDDNQPLEYLSEMRNVTVVFMNLVLDEKHDVTKLLQEVFDVVYVQSKVMHGCLNKAFFFDKGCTFLVIFGLPGYKHERDCAHALICSHKMKKLLDQHDGVKSVSIGVTTGGAFCGVVGHKNRHEYSVIGRKVNMAARLMMHYPNKVTCEERTFQQSRLPSINFRVLGAKRMKGLQNVGIIKEYVESTDSSARDVAKIPYFQFPLLGREQEVEVFELELQRLVNQREEEFPNHYIISGASGIGKTRLLDHFIHLAEKKDINVISCALRLQHLHVHNCLSNYIFLVLLSSSGFSHRIEDEPELISVLSPYALESKLHLLNDIMGSKYQRPNSENDTEEDLRKILNLIIEKCTEKQPVLVVVDDAQNVDDLSWKFLCELRKMKGIFIVLSSRPAAIEKPTSEDAGKYIESSSVRVLDLGVLDTQYIPALACQLMDVVRIPCELEVMLRERTQGVPYWCEQLLLDMTEKNQLIITYDDGSTAMRQNTIAPKAAQLEKVFSDHSFHDILDENDNDQIEYNRVSSSFKVKEDENPMEHGVLLGFGYIHQKDNKQKEKVAVFSPHINPQDIEVPLIMKELIIARLDSMRASEQLIVKCAAVLGQTFPRDMIEYILPKVQRVKARKSFRRLKQIGIFECANIPTGRAAILLQTNGLHPEACFCPKKEDDYDVDLCNVMRFKNNLLQQTAYNILMESQRLDLHNKTVEYLENQANEIRNRIPYYLLYRKPKESLEKKQVRVSPGAMRRSNKIGDTKMNVENENSSRKNRRGAVCVSREDIDPLIKAVCQLDNGQQKIDELVKRLIPIYEDIERHMRAAKDSKHIVDNLLEYAAAVILLKNAEKTREILGTVDELMKEIDDKTFSSDVFRLSKIARIRGKIAYHSGDLEGAQWWLSHAGKLLGIHQPVRACWIWPITIKYMIRLRALRNSPMARRPATLKTLEQGYCLSDLYWFYSASGNSSLLFLTALQQMMKVTGRTCHLHQVVESYANIMKLCKFEGTKMKLETELFAICSSRHDELSPSDLVMLASMYTDMATSYLNAGDLQSALSSSTGAYEVCDKLNNQDIGLVVSPILALCLVLTCRKDQFSVYLQKLRSFVCYSDGRIHRAWYYIFCMERILNGDYPVQSFQCCLDFATNYLRSCDAVTNEYVPRLFLAMEIALWFCRKGQWDAGQVWFGYSEMYDTTIVSFLALYALSRKIEIMLLSLNTSRVTMSNKGLEALKKHIVMDLKKLKRGCRKISSMLPRYCHLKAYFCLLNRSHCQSKWHLLKARKTATQHGNILELRWTERHKMAWFKKMDLSEQWNSFTEVPQGGWNHQPRPAESHMYIWPIVPKASNREKSLLFYSELIASH